MDEQQQKSPQPVPAHQGLRPSAKQRLGKYRLQKRLGKGGYCEVWKARDTVEGIWVALKIPSPDVAGKRDNETILREVRLVAQIRHPHIMPVKNADIIDHHAVLATELSAGTLEDCSRPMGVRRILSIIHQVLDGLSYAHQKRLVHCDVTPGNIFLFSNGRAALGDFGIGVQVTGYMKTIDDFGTPGYVAPEQAFGKPTYRSDCFSVALVLYEFLTGVLVRWPFHWPPKGAERLRDRTGTEFVRFMKKALDANPEKRFANAKQMLSAMEAATPVGLRKKIFGRSQEIIPGWQQLRKKSFTRRYLRVFTDFYSCVDCGEPIAESMQCCPWCGSERNRFDDCTRFSHLCRRCHKGVAPDWHYCPWCYGPGFIPQETNGSPKPDYQGRCEHCGGKMMNFMKYCPWCHRKARQKWQIWPFPEICGQCGWSVDSAYWNWCPWCMQRLL
ncbi:MAG: protein kinase [Phycisphaerae bacterium]|nr:protein kinase [Phycisphaerae bacterium]